MNKSEKISELYDRDHSIDATYQALLYGTSDEALRKIKQMNDEALLLSENLLKEAHHDSLDDNSLTMMKIARTQSGNISAFCTGACLYSAVALSLFR